MCTAVSVTAKDHYFGRNLDYEHTFGEKITITPRNYEFHFTNGQTINKHYAMIGMALPQQGYPLYFDGVNEEGLAMAGLNFPEYACYEKQKDVRENIASFELLPWVLCSCKTTDEAKELLSNVNITDTAFNDRTPPSPLHWMIADKEKTIVVEQTKDGLFVYKNPVGVLTNSPTFDIQLFNLRNFLSVTPKEPVNTFSDQIELKAYSRGMGGLGLPGDMSSMSRFVRGCFTKLNSIYGETEEEKVHQFFHILYSVYQQKGCVEAGDGFEMTNYSSCCNTDKGIYYYTTYYNSTICAVDMHREDLENREIICYDLKPNPGFIMQN